MNPTKTLCLSALAILTLAGCGTSRQVSNTTATFTAISAPLNIKKNKPLAEKDLKRWSHLDIIKDTVPGMSVDRAYAELLKDKKSVKVIVGIVDSGVDIGHDDLKSVIWTNEKEIAGNGIDDDKNGFIDDIHGWNFIGTISKEHYEADRILKNKSLVDEATYQLAKTDYDKKTEENTKGKERFSIMLKTLNENDSILAKHIGKPVYTIEELKAIASSAPEIQKSKALIEPIFFNGSSVAEQKEGIQEQLNEYEEFLNGNNAKIDYRKVLGDNPEDITDTKYGDNNVTGDISGSLHGTHVAGIVAQIRNNKLGGDGIADNVEIMSVRAVPMGDEYDKDVALGIRYAVDNGAKVINASFGKSFSPHKQWVYDAIKYAESKDVLIVHASGNEGKDVDIAIKYPTDSDDQLTEFADNLINIGALNIDYGPKIVARFSNYGKINVDLFAPGVKIYATTPENTYKFLQGTSMAAPNVAGVAALIRSYYPQLSAQEVKHILIDSGVTITANVIVGGKTSDIRPFSELSKSGKIANAYNALLLAEKMSKKK
ncbi:MAG: S8 family peptidase [Bacteroidota bacterium]